MGVGWGDINIHIDINMNVDIQIIIDMNIENYNIHYLLSITYYLLSIPYWLFPIGYFLLAIRYWLFAIERPSPGGPPPPPPPCGGAVGAGAGLLEEPESRGPSLLSRLRERRPAKIGYSTGQLRFLLGNST